MFGPFRDPGDPSSSDEPPVLWAIIPGMALGRLIISNPIYLGPPACQNRQHQGQITTNAWIHNQDNTSYHACSLVNSLGPGDVAVILKV